MEKLEIINKVIEKVWGIAFLCVKDSKFQLRKGQAFFNTLHDYVPEFCRDITGTLLDPFYDDCRIDDCAEALINYLSNEYSQEEFDKLVDKLNIKND